MWQVAFFLLLCACMLLMAHLILRVSPFYRQVAAAVPGRYAALDGLRGFLALGVFFHHGALAYVANTSDTGWVAPEGEFYTLIGQSGVALFFMITGFLFWGKALRAEGVMKPWPLYASRLRRLAPAYLFSVLLVLAVLLSPLAPPEPLAWRELGRVALFKGISAGYAVNGVYWTLVWEWRFYLLLPLLAWFAIGRRSLLVVALVLAYAMWKPKDLIVINFIAGGFCAALQARFGAMEWTRRAYGTILALVTLALALFFCPTAYGYLPTLLLVMFFFIILQGNSLLGLLHRPEAHLLGAASYSLYLLHCIVLYVGVNGFARAGISLRQLSENAAMGVAATLAIGVFGLSLASYRWLEHPFLRSGARQSRPAERVSAFQ